MLIVVETKWLDLHRIMPSTTPYRPQNVYAKNIENVIRYPHICFMCMHQTLNIFHELVPEKHLVAKDFWYRFMVVYFIMLFMGLE